jgi:hypothetical protein
MSKIIAQPGQRIKLTYESRDFEVIVIDPNGLGQGQPTVGLGLRMIEARFNPSFPRQRLVMWYNTERELR